MVCLLLIAAFLLLGCVRGGAYDAYDLISGSEHRICHRRDLLQVIGGNKYDVEIMDVQTAYY